MSYRVVINNDKDPDIKFKFLELGDAIDYAKTYLLLIKPDVSIPANGLGVIYDGRGLNKNKLKIEIRQIDDVVISSDSFTDRVRKYHKKSQPDDLKKFHLDVADAQFKAEFTQRDEIHAMLRAICDHLGIKV